MKFERGKSPKEALNIGYEGIATKFWFTMNANIAYPGRDPNSYWKKTDTEKDCIGTWY